MARTKKEPQERLFKVKQGENQTQPGKGDCLSPEALDVNSNDMERLMDS
jgi:hypothetical protein